MLLGLLSCARKMAPSQTPCRTWPVNELKRPVSCPRILRVERRVAARELTITRREHVLAQRDVLARDIGLVLATAIVETDNAAVGRRSLGPVDPSVTPESQLLGRMVTGRQVDDERVNYPGHRVHGNDPRTVILPIVLMG